MKKNLLLLITVLILATAVLVACNGETATSPDDATPSTPSYPDPVTFTVTFDSNGGTSVSNQNLSGIEYGQSIAKPAVTPTKRGYDFVEWTLSDGTAVNFDTYVVTSNVTIKATWKAKSFNNVGYLTDEKLKANIGGIGEEQTVSSFYGDNVDLKDTDDNSLVTVVDGVRTVALSTTYQDASSSSRLTLPVPTTAIEDDYFVYWYCYEGDEIVQLSKSLEKGSIVTTVELANAYNYDEAKDIYAMWHSSLKDVVVSYRDGVENGSANLITSGTTVKDGDYLTAPETPTRSGYKFNNWTYNYAVDGEYVLEDDEKVVKTMSFYVDASSKGVQIFHSSAVNGIFELTATWTKDIAINSADDFKALDGTDSETQKAFITLNADIDLGEWTAPFDEDNVYTGLFDGKGHTVTYTATDKANASLLGYVNGTISNLNVVATVSATSLADNATVGAVAIVANGTLTDVNATLNIDLAAENNSITVGGIVAINNANISKCSAVLSATLKGKIVTLGGIAGENKGSVLSSKVGVGTDKIDVAVNASGSAFVGGVIGKFSSGTLNEIAVGNATLVVNAIGNENCIAYVGGIAGRMSNSPASEIHLDNVTATVTSDGIAYVGGIFGYSNSILTHLNINQATVSATAVKSAYVGAIAGVNRNDGNNNASIRYAIIKQAAVNANSENGKVYAGGLVGDNYAAGTSGTGGLIGYCYASVAINVTALEDNAYINTVHGNKDKLSVVKNFFANGNSTVKLNGNDYEAAKTEGTYTVTDLDATLQTATWVNTNLNLNVDASATDPDTVVWVIADGSIPTLTFISK